MMMFTSETPHFFKVILEKTIQDGKIMVPKLFVEKHGYSIPTFVQLIVPTGELWSVKWKNQNGEVWFTKGWKAFSDYYSLRYGHFVIFTYKGDGIFDVVICDTTASEIDYPLALSRYGNDIVGESSSHGEKRKKSELPPLEKRMKSEPPSRQLDKMIITNPSFQKCSTFSEASLETKQDPIYDIIPSVVKQVRAPKARKDYTSRYPYFRTEMKEVHFTGRHSVLVPAHMRKRVNKIDTVVKLHVADRSWLVRYRNYARECILSYGWKFFAEENNLRIGDVCVFQHDPDTDDFNVTIVRNGCC